MSIIIKSITTDFLNGYSEEYFAQDLLNITFVEKLISVGTVEDDVHITFSEVLIQTELDELDLIISVHTPPDLNLPNPLHQYGLSEPDLSTTSIIPVLAYSHTLVQTNPGSYTLSWSAETSSSVADEMAFVVIRTPFLDILGESCSSELGFSSQSGLCILTDYQGGEDIEVHIISSNVLNTATIRRIRLVLTKIQ